MNNAMRYAVVACALVAGLFAGRSEASIVIAGTRIIYPAQDKEVTVKLMNEGKRPSLVQFWLDDGDEKSTPDTAKVPFTVMPPVFRIDGGKAQTVRIGYTGTPLPADKETLFWINALEIPSKPENTDGANYMQFAFRTRIKLFYRPKGLSGDAIAAPDKLDCTLAPARNGKGMVLQVKNPTPYYVNFAHVGIKVGERMADAEGRGGMVAPGTTAEFPIPDLHSAEGAQAALDVINDYGGMNAVIRPIHS
jgi:chaperone protein EcpD